MVLANGKLFVFWAGSNRRPAVLFNRVGTARVSFVSSESTHWCLVTKNYSIHSGIVLYIRNHSQPIGFGFQKKKWIIEAQLTARWKRGFTIAGAFLNATKSNLRKCICWTRDLQPAVYCTLLQKSLLFRALSLKIKFPPIQERNNVVIFFQAISPQLFANR